MTNAITIQQVYEELKKIEKQMVTKKEIESLSETLKILSNSDTMEQLSSSNADIKSGRVKEVNSAKDILDEI
ncbi:MAG: hypothetical protein QF632_01370 [Candidatus Woesearchaeota archaeon]|jgi:PHD/YefM family antitoxin component YafN of YafNO toxin-antitoxin module|nr:hypothetical protein [Candidatus Woesearchaeota archaeon]MDP7457111.1 hypothetical protein [Candidatus Woesearchaeota archaeon]|tara:strand:- start:1016 stop:1231 length:216 start_codon:yes stop_codon:yes gene_type:complete